MGDRFDFAEDERGVSGVVGFIFVFAILIILLSINQAQVVPAENSEVEFQHFQDVRDDLVEVRSAISTAGRSDLAQFPTVKLGTDYPPRILAVNPPPATGTLRTSQRYDIHIQNATDNVTVSTRFLEYEPNYNELDVGSTWYENAMLYLDERDSGGLVVIEEQGLVPENGYELRITALQNEFEESGSRRVSLELNPSKVDEVDELTGNLTVTLPTQLRGEEYWNSAFDDEPNFDPSVNEDYNRYPDGVYALNFSVQSENLTVNTVGVQAVPEGTAAKQNVGVGYKDSPNDDDDDEIVFESISATTAVQGQSLEEVTFDYDLSKSATVSFEIVGINSAASTGSSGSVTIDGAGENVAQTIRANISGGECYEYDIPQGTQSETINFLIDGVRC